MGNFLSYYNEKMCCALNSDKSIFDWEGILFHFLFFCKKSDVKTKKNLPNFIFLSEKKNTNKKHKVTKYSSLPKTDTPKLHPTKCKQIKIFPCFL